MVLALLLPTLASAQGRHGAPPAQAGAHGGPTERPHADETTQHVQHGIELLLRGDNAGAMSAFREAAGAEASRPEPQYYIGVANRMAGNFPDALAAFQQAAALAERGNAPSWRARALHGIASTLERMDGRADDARTAWQQYATFADANQRVASPQVGRARVQAIDVMNEQERVYVQVRQRIAEREEERRREAQEAAEPRRRGH
jgi:tetratricopeptide (TPR) repeat protein